MDTNKILEKCDAVIWFAFYVLIFFLPISISMVETFSSIALVAFFFKRGVVFYTALKQHPAQPLAENKILLFLKSYKPTYTILNLPIGIYIFINGLSVIFSQHHILSIQGFFFKLLQGTFIYFTFIEGFKARKQILIFMLIFFLAAMLISVDGIFQMLAKKDFIYGHVIMAGERITASFRHANDVGAYLIVVVPLFLSLLFVVFLPHSWITRSRRIENPVEGYSWPLRVLIVIVSIFAFICTGATYSRGVWLGLGVALLFFGIQRIKIFPILLITEIVFFSVFLPKMTYNRHVSFVSDSVNPAIEVNPHVSFVSDSVNPAVEVNRPVSFVSDSVNPAVEVNRPVSFVSDSVNPAAEVNRPVSFVSSPVSPTAADKDKDTDAATDKATDKDYGGDLKSTFNTMKDFRGMGRYGWWLDAVKIIRNYPTFGAGLNTYSKMTSRFDNVGGGYAHNCYLQMAAEIGILGLLVFLWINFSIYKMTLKNLKDFSDPLLEVILLGLLSGFTGFLAHSFVDTNLYSVQLSNFFWLLLALIMGIQRITLQVQK